MRLGFSARLCRMTELKTSSLEGGVSNDLGEGDSIVHKEE